MMNLTKLKKKSPKCDIKGNELDNIGTSIKEQHDVGLYGWN